MLVHHSYLTFCDVGGFVLTAVFPHSPCPLLSCPFLLLYNSDSPPPALTLGAEAYLPTFMSGFLAALMEEVLVVLAYFSRSKSTLPQRRAQPNQKERIQPQSREEREGESKYVEVALCS